MRKVSIIAVLMLLLSVAGAAAQDMRSLFLNAPDSLFPLLSRTGREDCIDFIDAGMRARVSNRLDGKSELLSVTPVYMNLKSSESSSVQMRLLPHKGDTIVAVVRSVCAEACDSRIAFYDREWNYRPVQFERPSVEEFFAVSDSLGYLLTFCDIYLVSLSLSPDDETLVAEYTMPRYMTKKDSALIAPKLVPLRYRWNGSSFVKDERAKMKEQR